MSWGCVSEVPCGEVGSHMDFVAYHATKIQMFDYIRGVTLTHVLGYVSGVSHAPGAASAKSGMRPAWVSNPAVERSVSPGGSRGEGKPPQSPGKSFSCWRDKLTSSKLSLCYSECGSGQGVGPFTLICRVHQHSKPQIPKSIDSDGKT